MSLVNIESEAHHVQQQKVQINNALTFLVESVITQMLLVVILLFNHGTIRIGDAFTEGEKIKFSGIPNFAPELFKRVVLKDPLKQKHY